MRHLVTDDSDIDAAELVFGELVTNALRYSNHGVRVEVRHEDDGFHLDVCDRGEGFDPSAVRQPDAGQEGGRGLSIVRRLSDEMYVDRADGLPYFDADVLTLPGLGGVNVPRGRRHDRDL